MLPAVVAVGVGDAVELAIGSEAILPRSRPDVRYLKVAAEPVLDTAHRARIADVVRQRIPPPLRALAGSARATASATLTLALRPAHVLTVPDLAVGVKP